MISIHPLSRAGTVLTPAPVAFRLFLSTRSHEREQSGIWRSDMLTFLSTRSHEREQRSQRTAKDRIISIHPLSRAGTVFTTLVSYSELFLSTRSHEREPYEFYGMHVPKISIHPLSRAGTTVLSGHVDVYEFLSTRSHERELLCHNTF